jgi:hypothetical protein
MRGKVLAILLVVIYFVLMTADLVRATDILVTSTVNVSARVGPEEESATSSPSSTSTSSGGGGGAILPVLGTQLVISGTAYPLAKITLLKNALVQQVAYADLEAKFAINLNNLEAGWFNLVLYAHDSDGNQSASYSLPVYVTYGAITTVNGVVIAPTLRLDRLRVQQGELVNISGQTAPSASLRISVKTVINRDLTLQADQGGWYYYKLATDNLAIGNYLLLARSDYKNISSPESLAASLFLTARDETLPLPDKPVACQIRADFNSDCKINLVDFSILAYWYKRPNVPARLDLQKNGVIDLADFSVMAYYWTG